jgi:hypothetical protein
MYTIACLSDAVRVNRPYKKNVKVARDAPETV